MASDMLTERTLVASNGMAVGRGKLSAHYRALVQYIQAANLTALANEAIETVGVTSCAPGAGVSTVAFNIAVEAARADIGPVLLVDADTTMHANRRMIPYSPALGLSDALADAADPMDCVTRLPAENLSFVSGRGKTMHDDVTFGPFKVAELLNEYKRHFKLVIVDVPAPTELNGSIYLSAHLDGVLLVIESEQSDGRVALKTKQQLVDANANILGVVLNKQRNSMPNWFHNLI